MATVDVTVASRTGRSRPVSEDRWVAVTHGVGLLLAVADGMGGTADGAAAAEAALAGLLEGLSAPSAPDEPTVRGPVTDEPTVLLPEPAAGRPARGADLTAAVDLAHERVRALATDGMPMPLRPGTTLTVAIVAGRRLRLAHLGDSSCWLLRRGRLRRLTEEHTPAAQLVRAGAVQPGSVAQRRLGGMLTRFAGMPGAACPQLTTVRLRDGDRLLVATDGVTRALTLPELATLLARPGITATELVEAAADAGGRDDATAVLLSVPAGNPDDMDTTRPDLNTRYVAEGAR